MRCGHKLSHSSKLILTFITNFNNITYEYYLKQPKSMLEWRLIEKSARYPKLIKAFWSNSFTSTTSRIIQRRYSRKSRSKYGIDDVTEDQSFDR